LDSYFFTLGLRVTEQSNAKDRMKEAVEAFNRAASPDDPAVNIFSNGVVADVGDSATGQIRRGELD
jgi:hypothetical protein